MSKPMDGIQICTKWPVLKIHFFLFESISDWINLVIWSWIGLTMSGHVAGWFRVLLPRHFCIFLALFPFLVSCSSGALRLLLLYANRIVYVSLWKTKHFHSFCTFCINKWSLSIYKTMRSILGMDYGLWYHDDSIQLLHSSCFWIAKQNIQGKSNATYVHIYILYWIHLPFTRVHFIYFLCILFFICWKY